MAHDAPLSMPASPWLIFFQCFCTTEGCKRPFELSFGANKSSWRDLSIPHGFDAKFAPFSKSLIFLIRLWGQPSLLGEAFRRADHHTTLIQSYNPLPFIALDPTSLREGVLPLPYPSPGPPPSTAIQPNP